MNATFFNSQIEKDWTERNFLIGNKIQKRQSKKIILAILPDYTFCVTKAQPKGYSFHHFESGLYVPTTSDYTTLEATIKSAIETLSECKEIKSHLDNALKTKINDN